VVNKHLHVHTTYMKRKQATKMGRWAYTAPFPINCKYDIQSAHSVDGKESCNRMALKRCTSTEMRWCRKLTSLDSPVLSEILLPFNRLLAEELRIIIIIIIF